MATPSLVFSTSLRSLSFQNLYRPYIRASSPLPLPVISFSRNFNRLINSSISTSVFLYKNLERLRTIATAKASSSSSMASPPPLPGITSAVDQKKTVEVFDTEEELAVYLAKYTADLSDRIGKERGYFTVVLSGGSFIQSLRKLVEPPYLDSIDWSKWHVFWVDERVVPKDHVDSNYKLAFDGFLSKVPILPGNVYAINDALSAAGAADDYETCLKHLVRTGIIDKSAASGFPRFDLMLVGMGPDGHVASLFPGHPLLKENQKWVTHITDSPKRPPERITFTFPVINSSAYIALVVCGSGKAGVVHRALGNSQNSDPLPVQRVSPEGELRSGFWTKMQLQSCKSANVLADEFVQVHRISIMFVSRLNLMCSSKYAATVSCLFSPVWLISNGHATRCCNLSNRPGMARLSSLYLEKGFE